MAERITELHKRNKLMVTLYTACLLLCMAVAVPAIKVAMAIFGLPLALVCVVLVWKRIATSYVMYIVAVGLSVCSFFFINNSTVLSSLFIIFFTFGIISIYHNYRPLLINGILSIAMLNYFIHTKPHIFGESKPFILNLYVIVTLAALIAQSRIGNRMLLKQEASAAESQEARERSEKVLQEVKESVGILAHSISSLQENVKDTGEITNQVVTAFNEISKGIESQAVSVTDISEAIHRVNENVRTVSYASEQMTDKSQETANHTVYGQDMMESLSNKIKEINLNVTSTTKVMNEVNEDNNKISSIVETIGDIANQTNLLSLNASIEASRAGEHGRGFAVVASEIRKLAQHSQDASKDIALIVNSIQSKIEEATGLVLVGRQIALDGNESADRAVALFRSIHANTADVLRKAEEVRDMNGELHRSSATVLNEITTVASVTEESSASVQEVLASSHIQQEHVYNIVDSIAQLQQLMIKLEKAME
jgi:methyl-accepting chemotaxis protein